LSPISGGLQLGRTNNSVEADGTNDYLLNTGGPTGAADGKTGTVIVYTTKRPTAGGTDLLANLAARITVRFTAGGGFRVLARNSSDTIILNATVEDNITVGDNNGTLFATAWDLGAGTVQQTKDGVDVTDLTPVKTNDTIDYTNGDWSIFGSVAGARLHNGDCHFIWFDSGYHDIVTNVTDYFENGRAKDPGSDGSNFFSTQPFMYFDRRGGSIASFLTDRGTSGDTWTENGALADGDGRFVYAPDAPTLDVTDHIQATIPVGALALTGYAPSIDIDIGIAPSVGDLALTGYAPLLNVGIGLSPITSHLSLGRSVSSIEADGTSDYYTNIAGPSGIADGKTGTVLVYLTKMQEAFNHIIQTQGGRFSVRFRGSELFAVIGRNTSGTDILSIDSTEEIVVGDNHGTLWAASWDLGNSLGKMTRNGVNVREVSPTLTNDTIDYTNNDWSLLASNVGTALLDGSCAWLWFDTNYHDIDASVTDYFESGRAKDPGSDGSNFFSTQPFMYFDRRGGAVSTFKNDKGTSGDTWTENGAFTDGVGTFVYAPDAPTLDVTENVQAIIPVGALALTGFAPSIDIGISPTVGDLTLTGYAPDISGELVPAKADLTLTGYAPTVEEIVGSIDREPTAAALVLDGKAGSLDLGIVPTVGDLTLTGSAPSVTVETILVPSRGDLTLTGQTATLDTGIQPTVGALALAGFAPTRDVSTDETILTPATAALALSGTSAYLDTGIEPPAGSVTLSGYAPTVFIETFLEPSKADLALTGFAPALDIDHFPVPTRADLTLTGSAPAVDINIFRFPGTASLSLTGYAPTRTIGSVRIPANADLTLTPFAPAVDEDHFATVPVGILTLTGPAPTVPLVWQLIDDSQTPGWTEIPGSQTPGWSEISGAQTPNWVEIDTS
jgi:hypothetical protein